MSDELRERLEQAGKKAEKAKTEKAAKQIKGSHLTEQINGLIEATGLDIVKNTGFLKVVGKNPRNKVLVARKGGRIDLSGFTIPGPAVVQVSEEDAKAKHLGKVRGQVNFDASDAEVIAVVEEAIKVLLTPAEPPAPKEKKVKKAAPAQAEQRAEA